MTKIIIRIAKDDNSNDIIITNTTTSSEINIDYDSKTLDAKDIYDLLGFSIEYEYEVENAIEETSDKNLNIYFDSICTLISDICKEINSLDRQALLPDPLLPQQQQSTESH